MPCLPSAGTEYPTRDVKHKLAPQQTFATGCYEALLSDLIDADAAIQSERDRGRKPLPPGTPVELAQLNLATGVAQRTRIFGSIDASGQSAVVPNVPILGWMVCLTGGPSQANLTPAEFVAVLLGADTDPAHLQMADMNDDGAADGQDISAYLASR